MQGDLTTLESDELGHARGPRNTITFKRQPVKPRAVTT
jgi:hypothetical protein